MGKSYPVTSFKSKRSEVEKHRDQMIESGYAKSRVWIQTKKEKVGDYKNPTIKAIYRVMVKPAKEFRTSRKKK